MLIYETENFILESHQRPEIDRLEGGHIKISPKTDVEDRTELTPKQAVEMMRLTVLAGEAMKMAMGRVGVEIGRINYQDNGNWNPQLHVHLYGRARGAVKQKYGDPVIPGHLEEYMPLNDEDIKNMKEIIDDLLKQEKYSAGNWQLV